MERIDVSKLEFLRIEPRGRAVNEKFWVADDNVKKLVKVSKNTDQDVMECLTSAILNQINIPCVDVELGYDKYARHNCCLITNFLTDEADVLYEWLEWIPVKTSSREEELRLCFEQIFNKFVSLRMISKTNPDKLKKEYIRILFGKCITENIDAKMENIGLIFNEKTNQYRLPPSFDNGFSFNSYKSVGVPYCCVGYQYFEIPEIIDYIMDNHFDFISDILPKLDELVENLDEILDEYEIKNEKRIYIKEYIEHINTYIKNRRIEKCK